MATCTTAKVEERRYKPNCKTQTEQTNNNNNKNTICLPSFDHGQVNRGSTILFPLFPHQPKTTTRRGTGRGRYVGRGRETRYHMHVGFCLCVGMCMCLYVHVSQMSGLHQNSASDFVGLVKARNRHTIYIRFLFVLQYYFLFVLPFTLSFKVLENIHFCNVRIH